MSKDVDYPVLGKDVEGKPIVHCWQSNEENTASCLELNGHSGPHVYVPDEEIVIHFK